MDEHAQSYRTGLVTGLQTAMRIGGLIVGPPSDGLSISRISGVSTATCDDCYERGRRDGIDLGIEICLMSRKAVETGIEGCSCCRPRGPAGDGESEREKGWTNIASHSTCIAEDRRWERRSATAGCGRLTDSGK